MLPVSRRAAKLFLIGLLAITSTTRLPARATGDTLRYFNTDVPLEALLGEELSADSAEGMRHVKVLYDSAGAVAAAEYVEGEIRKPIQPPMEEAAQHPEKEKAFRFFGLWRIATQEWMVEMAGGEVAERPYFQVALQGDRAVEVHFFRGKGNLKWRWTEGGESADTASIEFLAEESLAALDPHLFHPSVSNALPGWRAALAYDSGNRLVSLEMSDNNGQPCYRYAFTYDTLPPDSLHAKLRQTTTARYFLSSGFPAGSHRLVFSSRGGLGRKEFYDDTGTMTESVDFIAHSDKTVTAEVRDGFGALLRRHLIFP